MGRIVTGTFLGRRIKMLLTTALLALQLAGVPAATGGVDQSQSTPASPQEQKAEAQKPPTPAHTGLRALFGDLLEDVKHLPSAQNAYLAGIGGGLAAAAHPADASFNIRLRSHYGAVNTAFAPGKYVGDTPEQVALSLAAYMYGRAFDQPKVSHLGMDLIQAQLLTEMLVEPMKF